MEQFSIEANNLFYQPRKDRRGGGIALHVKDHLSASRMQDITVPDDIGAIWTSMRPYRLPRPINNLVIGVIYYPPRSVVQNHLLIT